jgi:hypothetical protein
MNADPVTATFAVPGEKFVALAVSIAELPAVPAALI